MLGLPSEELYRYGSWAGNPKCHDVETVRRAIESARGWVPEQTEDNCWSMIGEALAALDRIAGVLR